MAVLSLALVAAIAPVATRASAAGEATFAPVADTYINGTVNVGTSKELHVGQSPVRTTLMRFVVKDLNGTVTNARLRLQVGKKSGAGSDSGGVLTSMSDTSWSETAKSLPQTLADGPVMGSLGRVSRSTWYEIDVTPAVTGNGTFSFALTSPSTDATQYHSRESGSGAPRLVVETLSPTPTPVAPSPSPTEPPPSTDTYYVDSVDGSDANSGLSESSAWRSLTKAQTAPLGPGIRLLFKRGGSWTGTLDVGASGSASSPVVIGAYDTGSPPMIKDGDCVTISGSYVTLRDFQIDNCTWAGIAVSGSHNRVEDNIIMRNVAGVHIRSGARGNQVQRNLIKDNRRMSVNTSTPTDDDSGAFGVLLNGDETVVAYNTISGHDAFSYDYGRDGCAVEIYAGHDNVIHHNEASDNDCFAELGDSRSADNLFHHNVVRSSLAGSIGLVTRGATSGWGPVARTRLVHNTFRLTGSSSQGFVCHGGCSPDILIMRNNVIQATWKVGYADGAFDEDYDLFWGGQRQFEPGAHSVVADPAFVDPDAGNLRLRVASPAIDRGTVSDFTRDFDDRVLPWDGDGDGVAVPDIGAFESH